ncbi:MAG: hypothetical protein IJ570_06105 [Prevotella sp.]|nr:hypothetical protein [Bacteroidaceae bacterium]MBR1415418.1 hypothetical protein [Prevotella sp.]
MNKKEYQKPAMQVVKIQQAQMLCSSIQTLGTNLDDDDNGVDDFIFGGGSTGSGR